jgi:hypothetical protein
MNNKKQLDANGEVLSLASAKSQCDAYVAAITVLKNDAVTEFDGLEYKAVEILEDIKYEILKEQMRRELSNV